MTKDLKVIIRDIIELHVNNGGWYDPMVDDIAKEVDQAVGKAIIHGGNLQEILDLCGLEIVGKKTD